MLSYSSEFNYACTWYQKEWNTTEILWKTGKCHQVIDTGKSQEIEVKLVFTISRQFH